MDWKNKTRQVIALRNAFQKYKGLSFDQLNKELPIPIERRTFQRIKKDIKDLYGDSIRFNRAENEIALLFNKTEFSNYYRKEPCGYTKKNAC